MKWRLILRRRVDCKPACQEGYSRFATNTTAPAINMYFLLMLDSLAYKAILRRRRICLEVAFSARTNCSLAQWAQSVILPLYHSTMCR